MGYMVKHQASLKKWKRIEITSSYYLTTMQSNQKSKPRKKDVNYRYMKMKQLTAKKPMDQGKNQGQHFKIS